MGYLYGIFVWDICMGYLYGIFVWDICMGYFIFVWDICMGYLYGIFVCIIVYLFVLLAPSFSTHSQVNAMNKIKRSNAKFMPITAELSSLFTLFVVNYLIVHLSQPSISMSSRAKKSRHQQ